MTLKQFLQTEAVNATNPMPDMYFFEYKEANCIARHYQYGKAGETLFIVPKNSRADIGAGAGEPVLLTLEPEPRSTELLDTLETILTAMKEGAKTTSSFADTYYIMWNDKECIGELITRLIAEERKRLNP